MKIRPVRFPPCAAGASPTISTRAAGSPNPGTGRPQYASSRNAARFSRATSSRHATSRGHARHSTISAVNAVSAPARPGAALPTLGIVCVQLPCRPMRVLLIVNETATSVTARRRVLVQRVLGADHKLEVEETSRRGHATRIARGAALDGVEVVAVLAGDGTLNEAADGLAGTATALAPLPGGSTNVFAAQPRRRLRPRPGGRTARRVARPRPVPTHRPRRRRAGGDSSSTPGSGSTPRSSARSSGGRT